MLNHTAHLQVLHLSQTLDRLSLQGLSTEAKRDCLESLAFAQKTLWTRGKGSQHQAFLGEIYRLLIDIARRNSLCLKAFRDPHFQPPKTLDQVLQFLEQKEKEFALAKACQTPRSQAPLRHIKSQHVEEKSSLKLEGVKRLLAGRKVILVTSRQSPAAELAKELGIVVQGQPRHGGPSMCNQRLQAADIVLHDLTCTSHLKCRFRGHCIPMRTPITNPERFVRFLLEELPGQSAA